MFSYTVTCCISISYHWSRFVLPCWLCFSQESPTCYIVLSTYAQILTSEKWKICQKNAFNVKKETKATVSPSRFSQQIPLLENIGVNQKIFIHSTIIAPWIFPIRLKNMSSSWSPPHPAQAKCWIACRGASKRVSLWVHGRWASWNGRASVDLWS